MKVQTVSYKRSLVIGMLLGDANSRKRNRHDGVHSVCFTVTHSQNQADLVAWKAAEMAKHYGVNVNFHHRVFSYSCFSTFSFTQRKRLRVIHDWFHRGKRKFISEKIRFMDHPIGLAMLLCDDGSIRRRKKQHRDGTTYYLAPSITIATHCFSEEEVTLLLAQINRMCGAEGYINPERRVVCGDKVVYHRINFNAENSKILWNYVSAWMPCVPSMMNKFEFIIGRYGLKETASA
ncbi:MAG: hypothetical protein H0T92_10610 [Pyrinomonadaceae bacterium]|nr:hypothetical protein [Pyrinomonadaceae bacterium]